MAIQNVPKDLPMREINGSNIWDFYNKGFWIAITTNGTVKKNGEAVMGRG